MANRSSKGFPSSGRTGTRVSQKLIIHGLGFVAAFGIRTRKFEPGLNSGLAIQAKTATLVAKDLPAAQIFPPWPSPRANANYLIAGRVAEAGNGVRRGGLQRPFGH